MFSLYVIGFRNKANISYTGPHIHGVGTIFVTIKALCVALCLIFKEPQRNRFLTFHPELESGLCDSLQITQCNRKYYDETYANKSYLSQLQSHQLVFTAK